MMCLAVVRQAMLQNQDPEIQAKLMAMQRQMATTDKTEAPTTQQLQARQLQQSQVPVSRPKADR